jgi:hypothetical protein
MKPGMTLIAATILSVAGTTAVAQPYAEYNPTTGGIAFRELTHSSAPLNGLRLSSLDVNTSLVLANAVGSNNIRGEKGKPDDHLGTFAALSNLRFLWW